MRPYIAALALLLAASPAAAQNWAVIPDPTLTPGAVRTTDVGAICSTPTSGLRHWSRERDDRILAEYGLPTGPHGDYELDHLIPLCLGGADSEANIWPQPHRPLEPAWNSERKDELEARLCQLACAGALDVREAQREISEDWISSYQRRFRLRAAKQQRPQRKLSVEPTVGAMAPK